MKLFIKKRVNLSIALLIAICFTNLSPVLAKANTISNPNEVFNEVSINELEIGAPVVTYQNLETGEKVEIELIKETIHNSIIPDYENEDTPINTYGTGNSGWSGGMLPPYPILTLMVKADTLMGDILVQLEYKVDVNGLTDTILSAYGLSYKLLLWTMNSTSLSITNPTPTNYTNARAELNYSAVLIEYGIVVSSRGGYLNFEINSSGNCRTSWSI